MTTRHKAGRVASPTAGRPPIPIPGYGQYVLKRGLYRPLGRQPAHHGPWPRHDNQA